MILAAAAAIVLSACAKIETEKFVRDNDVISFGAYTGKSVTKSGTAGELTTNGANSTTSLQTTGFGVFAYQTTGTAAFAEPNFMYNTKVYGSSWTYDITKYWPNQIQAGGTDGQNPKAQADQADKVSFFAYGPYVAHSSAANGTVADNTYGITAFSKNSDTGDPKVTYTVSNDLDKQVDLVWGVADPTNGITWNNVAGTSVNIGAGMPYIGLQKPAIDTKIKFYFRHALSQLKLQAVAAYNQVNAGGTAQDGVKITIEKVELTVPGMTQSAVLNLNNTTANTPKWEAVSGGATTTDLSLTVSGDNINADLKDAGDGKKASEQPDGVTATAQDVITAGKYYTIIPTSTSTDVTVKVTYYVTTDDPDLKDGFSRVKNVISHDVTFANGFAANKKNSIKMILGISEVKFEAEVTDWDSTAVEQEVNLPINTPAPSNP